MDKRYQVFVSSTYTDLQEERRIVIQTLMQMDCIPSGMEIFPATDEEQFEFIKRIIDDCDYYIVLIGGRYGTITGDGLSYTEKEFDYAAAKGIKIIALIHGDYESIPVGKIEADPIIRKKLEDFKSKVKDGRLVQFWKAPNELAGNIAISLSKMIKTFPARGWVRADVAPRVELLEEINMLRKCNQRLEEQVRRLTSQEFPDPSILAKGSDLFKIEGEIIYIDPLGDLVGTSSCSYEFTWDSIFAAIGPDIFVPINEDIARNVLCNNLLEITNEEHGSLSLSNKTFFTIKIQLISLGLIDISTRKNSFGDYDMIWEITSYGKSYLLEMMSIKKPSVAHIDCLNE